MPVELKVPEVGESITEVEIGDWLKSEGEQADRDEAVVMIETDKVTVELPAPVSGVVTQILVKTGETASVGDVIGYMEEGAGARATSQKDSGGAGREPAPQPAERSEAPSKAEPAYRDEPRLRPASGKGSAPKETRTEREERGRRDDSSEEPRVMPAAQRVMSEAGLSVAQVEGTGPGGRVLKEDALRAEQRQAPRSERVQPADRPAGAAEPGYREEEVVAMSPMRRRIAERLVESQQKAALLTTFNEADMSAVMSLRKQYQPQFQEKYGIKLGFMSFFVKAAVDALKLIPQVNAEIRGSDIVYRNYYDIGVAVGGGRGLVVPVIRNAERLGFAEIEQTIADFAARAQKNQLKLEELQGGTFTISNGGVYGSMLSTPIINPPQSGILGMHNIEQRAVVREGEIVARPMMYLALTYDHRIVDGREAVTFLKRIKEAIEAPARMLIEV